MIFKSIKMKNKLMIKQIERGIRVILKTNGLVNGIEMGKKGSETFAL